MGKFRDLTGQRFGRLTAIEDVGRTQNGKVKWLCRCDCGREITVISNSLTTENTKSCGCIRRDVLVRRNTVHALSKDESGNKTRLYNIWVRMKQRCYDKNSSDYDRYGGRGIKICDEWMEYKNFHNWSLANGYNDSLTIERKDVNRGYCPDNCEWIAREEQARNKRNNHFIAYKGQRKTLAEWCEILGMEHSLLRYRMKHWGIEKAFTKPIRGRKNETAKSIS